MILKINKYEHIGLDKYRIYLENGEIIDTYDNVILANDLLLKKEIDINLYNKINKETFLEENIIACKKYIDYRLRSVKEIKDYLKKKNVDSLDIDVVIERLLDNNYLDDDKFSLCFIKDKLNFTNMGEYKIINELKRHEIDNSIIDKYYYLMDNEVMNERIVKLIDKSFNTGKDKSKLRNKLYNNLVRLGYPMDLVISNLNERF